MNHQLTELHLQRGRLLERIATQRAMLSYDAVPLNFALDKADSALARVQSVTHYIKRHPGIAGLGLAIMFALRTKRVWRWGRRAFFAWRTVRAFSDRLAGLGFRVGP